MAIVAGSLARKAAGAVGEALLNAAKSLLGRDKSAPPKPEWSSVQGMGLLGRLVGPMIQAALSSAASELAAAGKSTATARSQAEQILTCSPELAAALGGGPVQVVGVLSQGSVTQSVNGALSRRVVMQLVVRSSASGQRAQTSVECDVGAGGEVLAGGMTIWAVLESGRRIQVPVHDAGVGGKPIDVHWKRVD